MLLTGKEFNKKYSGIQFVKLTNQEELHNGYQFKDGLNVDNIPFNTKYECSPGGIYFCRFDNFTKYLNYGKEMYYMRYIIIPDDAQVFEESNGKYKTDKLFLSCRNIIFDNKISLHLIPKKICLASVQQDGLLLKHINNQTPEICLEAVRQNGLALEYVTKQTPEICLEAVKRNGYALFYVKEQTPEICLEAVKRNGLALKYVKEQTPEICLEAVRQNDYALQYVKKQTPEILSIALHNH